MKLANETFRQTSPRRQNNVSTPELDHALPVKSLLFRQRPIWPRQKLAIAVRKSDIVWPSNLDLGRVSPPQLSEYRLRVDE